MSSVFNNFNDDTICAIATAMSDAGIGIIRVSGKNAVSICDSIYCSAKMEHNLSSHKPNTITYGFICDEEGNDIFVHFSGIVSDDEYKTLKDGAEVEYEVSEGEKGPQAINVKAI